MSTIFEIIFGLLGGLALFIFALQSMGSGMQDLTGKKASKALEMLTSVPIVGVLFGALVTIVIQSSTVVTVMVVSLVNATVMTLKQAASVIMGANIGTTVTMQLVAFRVTDWWIYLAAVGFAVYLIAKPKNIKNAGLVLFSMGVLLLGIALMSDAMRPLRDNQGFLNMMHNFSQNRILGVLAGTIFTAIIQSSTAATGVIVAMTMEGLIDLRAALALILGANIGTCLTAVFASVGGSASAKRAAGVHVLLNLVGALIFLIFINQYEALVLLISPADDVTRQAANAHMLFSVISVIIALPFINQLVKLVTIIIPGEDARGVKGTLFLDVKTINNPGVAVSLAQKELLRMADMAGQNMALAVEGFIKKSKKRIKLMKKQEKTVDALEKEIVGFLTKVSQVGMSGDIAIRHAGLLHAANDVERVSDHARNIGRLAEHMMENDIEFPEFLFDEIKAMHKLTAEIYNLAVRSVRENNADLVPKVRELDASLDVMKKELRAANVERMSEVGAECSFIFVDIISNFERVGDHAVNITHLPQGKL